MMCIPVITEQTGTQGNFQTSFDGFFLKSHKKSKKDTQIYVHYTAVDRGFMLRKLFRTIQADDELSI